MSGDMALVALACWAAAYFMGGQAQQEAEVLVRRGETASPMVTVLALVCTAFTVWASIFTIAASWAAVYYVAEGLI